MIINLIFRLITSHKRIANAVLRRMVRKHVPVTVHKYAKISYVIPQPYAPVVIGTNQIETSIIDAFQNIINLVGVENAPVHLDIKTVLASLDITIIPKLIKFVYQFAPKNASMQHVSLQTNVPA